MYIVFRKGQKIETGILASVFIQGGHFYLFRYHTVFLSTDGIHLDIYCKNKTESAIGLQIGKHLES